MRNRLYVMLYDIKQPWRSFDLKFEISNLYHLGIHVYIASNGLWGHGDLLMTSEVIWPQIWNQQPWLPWYPCSYCLQWPPRPWWPPNDLGGHMTSDLKSETFITLVSMYILSLTAILVASEAMATSKWPQRSRLTSELNSVTSVTYVSMAPKGIHELNATTQEAKYDPLTSCLRPK